MKSNIADLERERMNLPSFVSLSARARDGPIQSQDPRASFRSPI